METIDTEMTFLVERVSGCVSLVQVESSRRRVWRGPILFVSFRRGETSMERRLLGSSGWTMEQLLRVMMDSCSCTFADFERVEFTRARRELPVRGHLRLVGSQEKGTQ